MLQLGGNKITLNFDNKIFLAYYTDERNQQIISRTCRRLWEIYGGDGISQQLKQTSYLKYCPVWGLKFLQQQSDAFSVLFCNYEAA